MFRIVALVIMLAMASQAAGQSYRDPPDDGYWWNPAEPGRGWTFEKQGELIAVTHYGYDSGGGSLFFQNVAIWNAADGSLTSDLLSFQGGQCFGCPFVQPTSASLGPVRFSFQNNQQGTVTYPNGLQLPISRFEFAYANSAERVLGSWSTNWVTPDGRQVFSNFFALTRVVTLNSGAPAAEGQLIFLGQGGRVLMGAADSTVTIYAVLINASGGFNDYYYVIPTTERMLGFGCTRPTTAPPPTLAECTGLVYGFRPFELEQTRRLFGGAGKSESEQMSVEPSGRVAALYSQDASKDRRPRQASRFLSDGAQQALLDHGDEAKAIMAELYESSRAEQ